MENEVVDSTERTTEAPVETVLLEDVPFEITEELLVEEISIDGMCGVY
jgi:mycofactocin precursor